MSTDLKAAAYAYNEDGFVIIRSMFMPQEVKRALEQVETFVRDIGPTLPSGRIYYEQGSTTKVKSAFNMQEEMPFFDELRRDQRVQDALRAIWPEGQIIPGSVMFFGKPALEGGPAPAHQDNTFQCWDPPLATTVTIALDEATAENGALICQRGSHKVGLLPHRASHVMGFSRTLINDLDKQKYPEVQLCMKPGDVSIHHVNTIHRSDPNRSPKPRRTIGLGYCSSLAKRDEAAWAQYHADLKKLHDEHKPQTTGV